MSRIFGRYWLILATIVLICGSFFLSLNQLFFFQFADEEDNFILGHFLLQGQKLYSDLFSHHQPFAYLISAGIQLFFHPVDIFELVQIHRYFMIGWSVVWIILLIWRFRERVIFSLFLFEIIKLYVLGNLFLSESLAVYPVLYLINALLSKIVSEKECLWIGFLVGFIMLLLAPTWPFLLFYLLLVLWRVKKSHKSLLFFLIGFIVPLILVLPYIDISTYFRNVFYINFKYYIPQSAEEKMPLALIKAIISPITVLFTPLKTDSLGFILKLVWPIFAIGMGGLIWKKNYQFAGLIILVLTLLNIRYYSPYLEYKAGFHSLVWLGVFCFFTGYFYHQLWCSLKKNVWKYGMISASFVIIALIFYASTKLFTFHDQQQFYERNYGQKELFGNAIKAMRHQGDSLFVIPDEWLLYFQGDVINHNRMVNYYGWMSLVWELNDPVVAKFASNPPAFLYCDCPEETVLRYSEDYRQLMRSGAKTSLWVRKDRFASLNNEQKAKLRSVNFQLE